MLVGSAHFQKALASLGHDVMVIGGDKAERCDLRKYNADLVMVHETLGNRHLPHGIEKTGAVTVFYSVDVHLNLYWHREFAQVFDYVFVTQKDYVARLGHENAYWLPWAIDPQIFYDKGMERIHDIAFVGTLNSVRRKRASIIEALSRRFPVTTAGEDPSRRITQQEIATLYSQAKIVVNESIYHEVNFRVFEATACGAMLLTERTGNGLADLFHDGMEMIVFDQRDFLEKAACYLEQSELRTKIAENGKRRTLTEHTIDARAKTLLRTLDAAGWKKRKLRPERCTLAYGKTLMYAAARFPGNRHRRYRRAEMHLREALATTATKTDATLCLGFLYLNTKQYDKLKALLEGVSAANIPPFSALQAMRLCSLLHACGGRNAAYELLQRINPAFLPHRDDFFVALGKAFEGHGLLHDPGCVAPQNAPLTAVDCYLMAYATTGSARALRDAGALLYRMECFDGACEYLEKAWAKDPTDGLTAQLLNQAYQDIYCMDKVVKNRDEK